jgi:polar amino acid transport system substrate-binding protein
MKQVLVFMLLTLTTHSVKSNQVNIVTEHLPPFQIVENDTVTGYATEVINETLSHTKLKSSIKGYPWTRAYNMALNNKNTCIYSIARTPNRENLFHWIGKITYTDSYFIGLKSRKDIKINSIEDAKQYKVAVIRDDVTHQTMKSYGFEENKNLYIVNNTYSLLKLLHDSKSIDLILADDLTIKYRALFNGLSPELFTSFHKMNITPFIFYLACSKTTDKAVLDQLSEGLKMIKANGVKNRIENKWSIHRTKLNK